MQKQDELGVRFGKYNVYSKLAVGGMAELFLAKQPGIGGFKRTVVLKCILPHLANEDEFVTMFLDEARIVAPLDHPNIVQIYDLGEEESVYYIAMEYIRGQTLKEFRKKLYHQNPDVKPYKLSAGLIAQAAAGLHHAHTAHDDDGVPLRLVHRDVSPTNLLISYNGVVKLVDFGVAKASNQQHQTSAGTIKGKYRYMSPEQIRGHDLDNRSDVFSLGIVLYELSTNAALFGRRNEAEIIDAVRNSRVPSPSKFRPDYPEALEHIVMKALEQDREARYQSADELRVDLERFMREEGAYYGTTQLAELMQYLFSKEQTGERTGVSHKPLTPADFVRFIGSFDSEALASYTGSFSKPKSNPSHSVSKPTSSPSGSSQWPAESSDSHNKGTPPHGPKSAVNHDPKSTPTPSPSPFADGQRPSPKIPHAEALELPEETRTELSAATNSLDDLIAFDAGPISSVVVVEDPNEITGPEEALIDEPKREKSVIWFVLLLLLIGGGVGGYFWNNRNTIDPTKKESFAQQKEQIETSIKEHNYIEAGTFLKQIKQTQLTPEQKKWRKQTQQAIQMGPRLDLAKQLCKKKQYDACIPLLEQILKKWPEYQKTKELIEKANRLRKEKQTQQNTQVQPRRVEPLRVKPRRVKPPRRRRRRRRRRWRRRRRITPPRRRIRLAKARIRPAARRRRVPQMGKVNLKTNPERCSVMVDGVLFGYTPIRKKQLRIGTYRITFQHEGYTPLSRKMTISSRRTLNLSVQLKRIIVVKRIQPKRARPKASGSKARYPFSSVRLSRRKKLRIYITDPRGLAGRHSTLRLRKLGNKIEREVSRLLGRRFRVRSITRAWQKTVRQRATRRNQDYHTFYPRAVAYTIYRDLLRGRSFRRAGQMLVKYEYRNRFSRIRK